MAVRVVVVGRCGGVERVKVAGMREGVVFGDDALGAACGEGYEDEDDEGDCDDREDGDLDAFSGYAGGWRVDGGYASDVGVVEGFGGRGRGCGGDAVCCGDGSYGGGAGGMG